jgi:Zn-dependent protease with chaperone function
MYNGFCFNDAFPSGRQSGQLMIESKNIRFTSDEIDRTLPLSKLKITLSGSGNRILYFSTESQKEYSFYTSDHAILDSPLLAHNPFCREIIKNIQRKKTNLRYLGVAVVLVFLMILILPFFFGDYFIQKVADQFPVDYERKLGNALFETITSDKVFIKDERMLKALETIVAPLISQIEITYPDHQFDFFIVDDKEINAFALPGGKVVIHSSLILQSQSPQELAGVLAHEISHVTQRHHIRSIIKRVGIVAIYATLLGDIGSLGNTIVGYGTSLATLKNSRGHETEADEAGWALLLAANIDPHGMITMFEKLHEAHDTPQIVGEFDFLSTHPAITDRIALLEAKYKSLSKSTVYHSYDIDYTLFQKTLRSLAISNLKRSTN